MIKLHIISHLSDSVSFFGGFSKGNTEKYEQMHRPETKRVWEVTSKREASQDKEMIDESNTRLYNYYIKLFAQISIPNVNAFDNKTLQNSLPKEQPTETEYSYISNIPSYKMYLNRSNNQTRLELCENENDTTLSTLLQHTRLSASKLY